MAAAVISSHGNPQFRTAVRVPGYEDEHIIHPFAIWAGFGLSIAGSYLAGKHANPTAILAGYLFGVSYYHYPEWGRLMRTTDSRLV